MPVVWRWADRRVRCGAARYSQVPALPVAAPAVQGLAAGGARECSAPAWRRPHHNSDTAPHCGCGHCGRRSETDTPHQSLKAILRYSRDTLAWSGLCVGTARSENSPLSSPPPRGRGDKNEQRARLSYTLAPLGGGQGRGGALYRECANDLCLDLLTNQLHNEKIHRTPGVAPSLHAQFQTYTHHRTRHLGPGSKRNLYFRLRVRALQQALRNAPLC